MNIKCQGNDVRVPGDAIESGLSIKAAAELGLLKGTPVGTSLIDAHAGGLGMIGCYAPDVSSNFSNRLGMHELLFNIRYLEEKKNAAHIIL